MSEPKRQEVKVTFGSFILTMLVITVFVDLFNWAAHLINQL